MFFNLSRLKLITVFFTFLLPVISISANPFLDNINLAFSGSLLYFASDNREYAYKTPLQESPKADPAAILPSAGISAGWQMWTYLRFELTEDIYFKNYEYNTELNYAMPCNPENREAFVAGFLTGFQLTGTIPIGKSGMVIRAYGGPTVDIRLVITAFGLHPVLDFQGDERDAKAKTSSIRKYLWGEGRWFHPVAGIGMDFPVNEKFLLGFDIRTWFPIYRQWTDKELAKIHGYRFGIGLRITPRKNTVRPQPPVVINLPVEPQTEPQIQTEPEQYYPQIEIQIPLESEIQTDSETQDDL